MARPEYYRRQADTLLALALSTSDPELSARCRTLAVEYKLLSEKAKPDPAVDRRGSTRAPTGEAEAELNEC